MKAYRFDTLDGLDNLNLHEEPMPRPQRGEVVVCVRAVALNYRDLAVALGTYVWATTPGLVPCSDSAGEIVSVGEGVRAWRPGDRVISTFHPRWFGGDPPATVGAETYGSDQDGWLCEFKAVSQEALVPLPEGLTWAEGATLPCAGTTAWTALMGSAPIRAGDVVLTLGSGGVSIFAVQLAKALGARVIATTSTDDKAARLRSLGADEVVNYRATSDWGRHVKADLTAGRGVDRVIEVGGPATVNESLRAVRRGGEVVLIGFLSQENPGIDYFHLKGSGATVRSVVVGDRAALAELVRAIDGAKVRPVIDRVFAFDHARTAFDHLHDAGHVGKIVISVGGE